VKVELSERARRTLESLVEDGTYPTVEAAVEAAIDAFDADWDGIDVAEIVEQARRSRVEGTVKEANEEYVAETLAKARAIIDSKSPR